MATAVPRLGRYRARLATAADCVANGETKRFTGVMCESFHDIWMELHEDLIVLQRVDRAEYKRRQAPTGLKVSGKAFGSGRRLPIAQRYRRS